MDYLSDMVARLQNAQRANKNFTLLKQNKTCLRIIQILQNEGFISHQTLISDGNQINNLSQLSKKNEIKVQFKKAGQIINLHARTYSKNFHISRVSKGTRKVYLPVKSLWKLEHGFGLYILSTSRGVLTDRQAKQYNVGGEVLCKVR